MSARLAAILAARSSLLEEIGNVILAQVQQIFVGARKNIGRGRHRTGRSSRRGGSRCRTIGVPTVKTRGDDNLAILRAFEFCRPGDVMVIDADGGLKNAVVGGILSFYGATIGLHGMVIDGSIRDIAEIAERTFPVYARGVNHRGPYKDGPGAINIPVSIGGMAVNPGDIIVGDQDGLLAFPQAMAVELIKKAQAQHAKEEATMQAMRNGTWDRSFIDALEARCVN